DRPVKERVVAGDALIARRRLDVLEERREAADDAARLQRVRDAIEILSVDARFRGARGPNVADDLLRRELALERREDLPFTRFERHDAGRDDVGQNVGAASRLEALAPDVSHAERK